MKYFHLIIQAYLLDDHFGWVFYEQLRILASLMKHPFSEQRKYMFLFCFEFLEILMFLLFGLLLLERRENVGEMLCSLS